MKILMYLIMQYHDGACYFVFKAIIFYYIILPTFPFVMHKIMYNILLQIKLKLCVDIIIINYYCCCKIHYNYYV